MTTSSIEHALSELTAHACPKRGGELMGIAAVREQVSTYASTAAALDGPAPHICESTDIASNAR